MWKAPSKLCLATALSLTPMKNLSTSFNKNTPEPQMTISYHQPVIVWLEWMTRLESRFLVTRTRITLRKMVTRLDSCHASHRMARLESEPYLQNFWASDGQIQFVCTQRNEHFLLQWWSRLAQFFYFDCLVVICYLKDQVFPTCKEIYLRLAFQWGTSRAQCTVLIPYCGNVVFVYRDHGSRHQHIATLRLFQIPIKWFQFFKSNPKILL